MWGHKQVTPESPPAHSRELADGIPGARLVEVTGGRARVHLRGHPAELSALLEFLNGEGPTYMSRGVGRPRDHIGQRIRRGATDGGGRGGHEVA
jgi:hypothetical protein